MTDQIVTQPEDVVVVKVPVNLLVPNAYNPNQQSVTSFELLVKSIEEDGFTLPVVVNSGVTDQHLRNMIIDGEHRWRAAQVLNMPEVPVVYKDMSEADMRVSTIRHNKARGHHDSVLEAKVLQELAGSVDSAELKESLGLDDVELDVMLKKAGDYTDAAALSELSMNENLEALTEQGLTGAAAQTVAQRHGVANAHKALSEQTKQTLQNETGKNVRLEFIFSGEDADFMKLMVSHYQTAKNFILSITAGE
jgi:ParB-like chromosome segregation protein Spo0J